MSDDLAARIVEAAALGIANVNGNDYAHLWRPEARAALAAAVREAGLDAMSLSSNAANALDREAAQCTRVGVYPHLPKHAAICRSTAALLRALGGIADG